MKNKINFYVLYKDFNTGEMTTYDVMPTLYNSIFNSKGKFSKSFSFYDKENHDYRRVKTINELRTFIENHFRYHYWSKCEWEFIVSDWPPTKENRSVKIDVFDQLKPNIDLITNIVWEQIKTKINDD